MGSSLKKTGKPSDFHIVKVEQGNIRSTLSAAGLVIASSERVINAPVSTEIQDVLLSTGAANYDFYKALLKPTVSIRANLPNYSKTFSPVVQDNGTISFNSISQAKSSVSLFAPQVLPSTGGT